MRSQCFQATPKDPGFIRSITLITNLRVRRIKYFLDYVAQESQNTREKAGDLENMSKLFILSYEMLIRVTPIVKTESHFLVCHCPTFESLQNPLFKLLQPSYLRIFESLSVVQGRQ